MEYVTFDTVYLRAHWTWRFTFMTSASMYSVWNYCRLSSLEQMEYRQR